MHRNLFISNSKNIPLAFISALILLILTELLIRFNAPHIRSFSDNIILYKMEIVEGDKTLDYDGIILGDSRMIGVNAKKVSDIVSAKTAKSFKIYNFSFPEQGLQGYYLFLKRYLQIHKKPQVIIFGVSPVSWTGKWNLELSNKQITTRLHRFCLMFPFSLYYEVFSVGENFKVALAKVEHFSMLVSYRRVIKNLLEGHERKMPNIMIHNIMFQRSGGINYGKGSPPTKEEIINSGYYNEKLIPHEDAVFWYRKFFLLTQKQDIKIFYYHAPLNQLMYLKREDEGINAQYEKFIRTFEQEFDHIKIMDPFLYGYDRQYFEDVQHLNGRGFKRFSRELGNIVAKSMK